jgi:hypothetical protein
VSAGIPEGGQKGGAGVIYDSTSLVNTSAMIPGYYLLSSYLAEHQNQV